MRSMIFLFCAFVASSTGCTKRNENLCCIDEADCNQIGESAVVPCNDGFVCRGNQCIAIACTSNTDCDATAPFCDVATGRCEEACAMDNQCPGFSGDPTLNVCESGSCVACRDDAQCGGSACINNVCIECRDDAQCGGGLPSCVSNMCVECSEDSQCDGAVGACVDNVCIECREDAQCSDPTPACVSNQCLECRDNSQCEGNRPICDGNNECRACSSHTECESGVCGEDGACVAEGRIAYTAPLGSSVSTCTKATPCTFTRALDLTSSRDTILLIEGSYMVPGDINVGGTVRILGNSAVPPRIVSTGTNVSHVIRIGRGADVTFDNVVIGGARGNSSPIAGAGISCIEGLNRVRLQSAVVEDNDGPGIVGFDCQVIVADSVFRANRSFALELRGTTGSVATIDRSVFTGNYSGARLAKGDFDVRNSIFARNGNGVEITPSLGSSFEFNTVVDNDFGFGCDPNAEQPDVVLSVANSIVARNGANNFGTRCTSTSSLVTASVAELRFVRSDVAPYDYHITSGSTAIDAATGGDIAVDVDNEPRPVGVARDLGADELQ